MYPPPYKSPFIEAVKRTAKSRIVTGFFLAFFTVESAICLPLIAEAAIISSVSSIFNKASAAENTPVKILNSQTMPLLQAPLAYALAVPAEGGGDISVVDGTSLMSETGQFGSVADLPEHPHARNISVYAVHEGDTVSSIAKLFNVSVNTILWANDIDAKSLKKDQVLIILPISGIQHTVVKGDTIEIIAKKYKADAKEIFQYNDISTDLTARDVLEVGSVVVVPDAELAAPLVPASAKKTAASGTKGLVVASGTSNPFRGGSGPRLDGYFAIPILGAARTQGLHGENSVDLAAKTGTSILAAAAGKVIIAKEGGYNGGYGSYVVISHANGTQTLYAHMSKVFTSIGATVTQGEAIGAVGMTGHATGPHLHFEVRGAVNYCADVSNPCSTN